MGNQQKRISMYFNLDNSDDRLLWEWLNSKKKSRYIKRLIEDDMDRANSPQQPPQVIYIPHPPQNYAIQQPHQPVKEDEEEDNLDDLDLDL